MSQRKQGWGGGVDGALPLPELMADGVGETLISVAV